MDSKQFRTDLTELFNKYTPAFNNILNKFIDLHKDLLSRLQNHQSFPALLAKKIKLATESNLKNYDIDEKEAYDMVNQKSEKNNVLMQLINQYLSKYFERYDEIDEQLEDSIISEYIDTFQQLDKLNLDISQWLDNMSVLNYNYSINLDAMDDNKLLFMLVENHGHDPEGIVVQFISHVTKQNMVEHESEQYVFEVPY